MTAILTEEHLRLVQRLRKAALLILAVAAIAVLPFVGSAWSEAVHDGLETFGIGLMIVAITGRAWCSLYIGGRKLRALVTTGPYSVSRNPLYLFTFIGVFGLGLQTGAVLPAAVLACLTVAVFATVVPYEELALRGIFGPEYITYCARVPRYWPRFSTWQDSKRLEVEPATIVRTVADALPLLLAYPVMEAFEYLQNAGLIDAAFAIY
ncbi:sodium:proton antiporter [Terrihabitans soli]|uniref:Sodium:proton antiporter n=1 Tax=Terrihabitans soli TaxID=708113 RepID=A0A6S6QNB6_9HYPH|nr:isoprenylcysteine carboxylmethyltransferase family protein [Terrihabitans soli]BCJ92004.1 sodium:proton antiporter [Terrihabitans soli]